MTRFLLDTGIAGLYLDRKRGVFERAEAEASRGNRVGIAAPVLAAYFLSARTLPNFRKQFSWTLPVCPGKGSSKKARLGDHSSLPADSLQFGRRLLSEGRSGVSVEAYIEGCAIVSRSN